MTEESERTRKVYEDLKYKHFHPEDGQIPLSLQEDLYWEAVNLTSDNNSQTETEKSDTPLK